MPEEEHSYSVMDIDAVQDPEMLLLFLASQIDRYRMLERALAMTTLLLLHHLDETPAPEEGTGPTIRMLQEFLVIAAENWKHEATARQMADLLEAQE